MIFAALTPIQEIAKMVNIGTLLAFVMVAAAVMILRVQRPNVQRPFLPATDTNLRKIPWPVSPARLTLCDAFARSWMRRMGGLRPRS